MARHEYPPKGFGSINYPLPHTFEYFFGLSAEGTTKDATNLPLFRASEVINSVEGIECNPSNPAFGEQPGSLIAMNSIVPKITLNMHFALTKGAIETDKIRAVKMKWMPIYTAFLDSLTAEDTKTATEIEDVLLLTHNVDNKDVHPTYSGTDLDTGTFPVTTRGTTEVFGDAGLTTDLKLESVAFNEASFWDAMRYYSNKQKLATVVGKVHSVVITRDRPYTYFSQNFTMPTVKRGNPYTGCFILMWLPQAGATGQFFQAADTTAAMEHIYGNCTVHYSEWNADMDQTAF